MPLSVQQLPVMPSRVIYAPIHYPPAKAESIINCQLSSACGKSILLLVPVCRQQLLYHGHQIIESIWL
ncbi:hypothetical protein BROC_00957 [Candidatus Brocadiaceae bacterium]|nr:hypothetical protein BROC_00957 [Candidatus Brocadiaceae bacterium]